MKISIGSVSPSQQSQLILLKELPEELWQHFIQQKPPKGKLHLFLLHKPHHTQQLGVIFLLPPYNYIPVHPALVPPSSQYSMLAPNLLQLVLPTGAAAESWEMTTSAKCTETRQRGGENSPSPHNPKLQHTRLGVSVLHHVPSVTLDQHMKCLFLEVKRQELLAKCVCLGNILIPCNTHCTVYLSHQGKKKGQLLSCH